MVVGYLNAVGVDYRQPWGSLELELLDIKEHSGNEFALSGIYKLSDYWDLGFRYESFSKQTPIRAFISDVDVKSSNLSLSYRLNESEDYNFSLSRMNFSDSNQRMALNISGKQTLYRGDDYSYSLFENIYWEKNSQDTNRLYFNPERLLSVGMAVEYQSILYKNAIRQLSHSIRLDSGFLKQKNFNDDFFWSIDYRHHWKLSNRFSFNYGFGYAEKIYDGKKRVRTIRKYWFGDNIMIRVILCLILLSCCFKTIAIDLNNYDYFALCYHDIKDDVVGGFRSR